MKQKSYKTTSWRLIDIKLSKFEKCLKSGYMNLKTGMEAYGTRFFENHSQHACLWKTFMVDINKIQIRQYMRSMHKARDPTLWIEGHTSVVLSVMSDELI